MIDLRPLRSPAFRRLASTYLINEFGTWIGDVALALLVWHRTDSPLATAALFLALRFLPSFLAPLLTSWAETIRPSLVLPALYVAEAVLYAGIALLAGSFSLAGVLVLAAADGVLAVTAKALTRSANANLLIGSGLLREGNALLNMGFMVASAAGPAVGGLLVAWNGTGTALAVDAGTFVLAALLVLGAHQLKVESDIDVGAHGRLLTGLRVIADDRKLLLLFTAFGLVMMICSVAVPVEVVFASHILHAGDRGYGLLLSSWGLGMIVGGTVFATIKYGSDRVLLFVAGVTLAAGYGGMAVSPDLGIACAFSGLGGIGNGIGGITVVTAIQKAIPLKTQSVVMSVFEAINQAMPALGFVFGGIVTALLSARAAYAVSGGGVAVLLLGVLVVLGAGRFRSMTKEPVAPPKPHTRRNTVAAVVHLLLLSTASVVAIVTAHSADWNLWYLAILLMLSCSSDLIAVRLLDGTLYVSGSFLSIMLAAVLLGGAPAAIVGTATIAVGWLRTREAAATLLHNLASFAAYPLVAGLVFHALRLGAHIGIDDAGYPLLVLLTFIVGLVINLTLAQLYVSFISRSRPFAHAKSMLPIVAPELFAAMLTVGSAYVTVHLGPYALILVAIVLVLFQYLVRELLLSKARGVELQARATTDELTGLSNRSHFTELLTEALKHAEGQNQTLAVMLLNLDHFRDVNDTLGHEHGDQLLRLLVPRLREYLGENGLLARLGDDEFVALPTVRDAGTEELDRIATELRDCIREPITVGGITMGVNVSAGIARYPKDGGDAQTLLRRADIALRDAKQHRDGHSFYDSDRDHHSARRLSLLSDFRVALDSGEQIVLMYHPIVDIEGRRLHGVEALVRWRHPELGMLAPGAFLATVEHTGLIGPLTATVLDQAVRDCVAWDRTGLRLTVSVNLSVRNLHDQELPELVARTLRKYGLEPSRLKLEITESMFVSDLTRVLVTVGDLRAIGVRLAVDDFGTGHSSLASLRMLPVDELKVDRSFVTPMLREPSDLVIVRSTIELGHALGLVVVAEGVEDAGTLDMLQQMHCDRAQGHYFSQPVPADALARWAPTLDTV